MKILFGSQYSGQTGTTSNLCAISAYLAYHYPMHIFILQARYGMSGLDHAMMGSMGIDGDTHTNGIDMLNRLIKSEPITKEMIESCSVNLYHKKLHILPCSMQQDAMMFDTMIKPAMIYCMNAISQYYNLTMLDANTTPFEDSMIKHSDYIVMNVSQNQSVLEDTFHKENKEKNRTFYLIGNYDPVSKYNVNYIVQKYKIPSRQIGVIPYNTMFRDAYSDGTVVRFMSLIDRSTKDEMNHYFIATLGETVRKLMKFCKMPCEEREEKFDLSANVKNSKKNARYVK